MLTCSDGEQPCWCHHLAVWHSSLADYRYLREQLFLAVLGLELDLEAWGCDLSWVLPFLQTILHHVTVLRVRRNERLASVLHLKDDTNVSKTLMLVSKLQSFCYLNSNVLLCTLTILDQLWMTTLSQQFDYLYTSKETLQTTMCTQVSTLIPFYSFVDNWCFQMQNVLIKNLHSRPFIFLLKKFKGVKISICQSQDGAMHLTHHLCCIVQCFNCIVTLVF